MTRAPLRSRPDCQYAPRTASVGGARQHPASALQHALGNRGVSAVGEAIQLQGGLTAPLAGVVAPDPCDARHTGDIDTARTTAADWRRATVRWLETHLDHLRQRARMATQPSVTVGATVFGELSLLNNHFRIADDVRALRAVFPFSATDRVSVSDLQSFGQASYWVRRRFGDLDLSGLTFDCQAPCPTGRHGSDLLGSAEPGSHHFTIYTNCFDGQHPNTKAGVVMHEAFHASFWEFSGDTYSFESAYPGPSPMTNAESFAMFSARVATGGSYRIRMLPAMNVYGSPTP